MPKASQLSQRLRHPMIVGLTLLAFLLQPLAAASSSSCRRAAQDTAAHTAHQKAVAPQHELQSEEHGIAEEPSCHATAPAARPSSHEAHHTAPAETPSHEDCSCCDDACCCVTAPPPAQGADIADITPPDDPSRIVVDATAAAEALRRLDTFARGPPTS